jgi:uncharacterized GH25 family protein
LSATSVAANSPGAISIHITGLNPGDKVRIDRFLDVNGDGKVEIGKPLVQSFLVTDGVVPSFGGVSDPNMFGDVVATGTQDGQITTRFSLPASPEIGQTAGNYLIRVSSPTGEFRATAPVTFTVTQPSYGQNVSGRVLTGSSGLANAVVVALTNDGNMKYVASTVADGSGNYSLNVPVGTYSLLGVDAGYVASVAVAPSFSLSGSQTLSGTNVPLTPATSTINGQVQSSESVQKLRGVQLFVQSVDNNYITVASSDSDGNFDVSAVADQWNIQLSDKSLPPLGYLASKTSGTANTAVGSVGGVTVACDPVNALVYGTLKDSNNLPLAGIEIDSSDNGGVYSAKASTDPSGNYAIGIISGTSSSGWWVGPSNNASLPGYVLPSGQNFTPAIDSATQFNMVAQVVTAHLQGTVTNNGMAVSGAMVDAYPQSPGNSVMATTDSNGNFDLGVTSNGTWNVSLDSGYADANNLVGPSLQETVTNNQSISSIVVQIVNGTGTITGSVKDSGNNPLTQTGVYANATIDGVNYSANAQTDGSGSYSFPVISGTWTVNVSQTGFAQQTVTVAGSAQINFTPLLVIAHLQGTVTNNGMAVSGAMVDAYPQSPGNSVMATTDSNGNFDLGVTSNGMWNVSLDNGYADANNLVGPSLQETVTNNQSISSIVVQIVNGTGTIIGSVKDSGNNPLTQTGVYANATINGVNYSANAQTDSNGDYSLPVIAGTWNVNVSQNGYNQTAVTVTGSGATTENFLPQSDASLAALSLSGGALTPSFNSGHTQYSADVGLSASTITVTPTVADQGATVQLQINGGAYQSTPVGSPSAALPLNSGSNLLAIQVLAVDGTTTLTYSVSIVRAAASTVPVYSVLAAQGDSAPGISDTSATFLAFGSPAINDEGHCAVQATVTGTGKGTTNTSGIWVQGANGPELIARTGTGSIPFLSLGDPLLNNADGVAFIGTLKNGVKGIWSNANNTGALQAVAQTNGTVPDTTGSGAIPKAKFAAFSQVVLPDQGGVVFLATLNGVSATTNEGIWAMDPTGLLKRIASKGDTVAHNGATYTITALNIFSSTAGTTAQTRSFNSAGDLIYRVTYQNVKTKQTIEALQTVVFP